MHALGKREAKAGPMHILESNHRMAKPGDVLMKKLPSLGPLKNVKEHESLKGSKTTITWHIRCSPHLLRRITNWEREGEGVKAPNPPWRKETPYAHLDPGTMGTTNFESRHEDTNEPCQSDKCNVLLERMHATSNPNMVRGRMESNCRATTNVCHNQRCAHPCFPWSHLSSPLEDTPCDR